MRRGYTTSVQSGMVRSDDGGVTGPTTSRGSRPREKPVPEESVEFGTKCLEMGRVGFGIFWGGNVKSVEFGTREQGCFLL